MSETTNIEWCDATVNFWWGCTKVSPGCANCYADTLSKRFGKKVWGKGVPREDHRKGATKLALKLDKQAKAEGRRLRVFSASMSDWLDPEVPAEWLSDLLATIYQTPNLDWLLLTKRPYQWATRIKAAAKESGAYILYEWLDGTAPANVWIGTTAEDQKRADERIPALLSIPAKVRFLSCEPLLEKVDLMWPESIYPDGPTRCCGGHECGCHGLPAEPPMLYGIHWLICGGESGPGCREFNPDWARSLRDQCKAAHVAFFLKQMGGTRKPFPEIPADLMIREFPKGGEA